MATILHLMPAAEWRVLEPLAPVISASLTTDGFIHCTDDRSVLLDVANGFYTAVSGDFVVLEIDTDRLSSECVWEEPAPIGPTAAPPLAASFPHVYGPINRGAIIGVVSVVREADGSFAGYTSLND